MKNRPKSIAVIGWLIIAMAIADYFFMFFTMHSVQNSPFATPRLINLYHNPIFIAWLLLMITASLIAGIYILKGKNWARWLFIITIIAGCISHLIIQGITTFALAGLLPSAVILVIFAFFLFRKTAKLYFAGHQNEVVI